MNIGKALKTLTLSEIQLLLYTVQLVTHKYMSKLYPVET